MDVGSPQEADFMNLALNNPESLALRGLLVEMALWELQGPGLLMPESCKF